MKKTDGTTALYPDAMGFQAGAEYSFPVQGGYWEFGLEGVYTYPYLYILWDKGWSFYKEVPELDNYSLRYWTGTPFGPDTIAGIFWMGFRSSSGWRGSLSFEFAARGERSDLSIFDYDNFEDDSGETYRSSNKVYDVTVPPTGIPVFTYTARLRFEYYPSSWISFAIQPGYRAAVNAGKGPGKVFSGAGREEGRVEHSFEVALSVRFKPPVR